MRLGPSRMGRTIRTGICDVNEGMPENHAETGEFRGCVAETGRVRDGAGRVPFLSASGSYIKKHRCA